jgi:hypothetical protein
VFIEAAARRISRPDMDLAKAAFRIRTANVNTGWLWQRQAIAVFGLDHLTKTPGHGSG